MTDNSLQALGQKYRISVVIPNYNYEQYVGEALDSVLAQSFPAHEIIVVDDGSTDNSVQVISAYGDKVRLIEQPNQHLSAARNTGINAATGNWIALLDSDDLWHPLKLELQVRALEQHPDWAFVSSQPDESDDFPQPLEVVSAPEARAIDIRDFITKNQMSGSDALIRKDCFNDTGLFDTSLKSCEDRDMWHRLTRLYKGGQLQLPLYQYRKHPLQMNHNIDVMIDTRKTVIERLFKNNPELKHLERQAWSNHYFETAISYRDHVHRPLAALGNAVISLLKYPGNYYPGITAKRLKFLAVTLLRSIKPGRKTR
ncbi:glycosyltransferase family 2 protein [Thiolapillus sp.]